jgi:hypothetical protein
MDKNALATPLPFWLFCYECGVTEYKLRGNALQASILALCTGGYGLGRIGVLSVLRGRAPSYRRAACCKHDEEKGKKSAYVPAEKRSCHDLLFVLLFFTFWLGMFIIAAVAVAKGDPKK